MRDRLRFSDLFQTRSRSATIKIKMHRAEIEPAVGEKMVIQTLPGGDTFEAIRGDNPDRSSLRIDG